MCILTQARTTISWGMNFIDATRQPCFPPAARIWLWHMKSCQTFGCVQEILEVRIKFQNEKHDVDTSAMPTCCRTPDGKQTNKYTLVSPEHRRKVPEPQNEGSCLYVLVFGVALRCLSYWRTSTASWNQITNTKTSNQVVSLPCFCFYVHFLDI